MISFEFDWVDAPNSGDLLDAATFSKMVLRQDDLVVSRVYDRAARSERDGVFVPLFPLARWMVDHWWSLLYEPASAAQRLAGPGVSIHPEAREWVGRHCLRVAVPGFALPFACIYSEGATTVLASRADPRGSYPSSPVEFRENAELRGDRESLRNELTRLVQGVLTRLASVVEPRLDALRADWKAICTADTSEAEFCRGAGRLGLDPYAAESWPSELLAWFESANPGELDEPLVTDLLEAPDARTVKPAQHAALRHLVHHLNLGAGKAEVDHCSGGVPYREGYDLARRLRTLLQLPASKNLEDLRTASEAACGQPLVPKETTTLPAGQILGMAGWSPGSEPVVAYRRSTGSKRFVQARGLYLALKAASGGPRLITDARTQEQQASRAFAAELLAPQEGVLYHFAAANARVGSDEAMHKVAKHYAVDSMTIQHQLQNLAL